MIGGTLMRVAGRSICRVGIVFALFIAGCLSNSVPSDWSAPGTQITVRPHCPPDKNTGVPRVWVGGVPTVVSKWDAEQVVFVVPADFEPGLPQPVRLIWGACEPGILTVTPGLGGTGSGSSQGPLYVHVSGAGRRATALRNAKVYIDGRMLGRTGRRGVLKVADVAPGPHRITVQRDGFESVTFLAIEGRRVHAALRPAGEEAAREVPKTTVRVIVDGACEGGEGAVRWSFTDPVDRSQDTREVPFSLKGGDSKLGEKPEILIQNAPAFAGGAAAILMKCSEQEIRGGTAIRNRSEDSTLTVRLDPLRFFSAPVEAGGKGVDGKEDSRSNDITFSVSVQLAREEIPVAVGHGPKARLTVPVLPSVTSYTLMAHYQDATGEVVLRAPGVTAEILASGSSLQLPRIPDARRAGPDDQEKGVLLAWDVVPGADLYLITVSRAEKQKLFPHWTLWVPAGLPTASQAGVWIPFGEAPISPERAGIRITAYSSLGFSPQFFTEGSLMDRMTMATQAPTVVLDPGQTVGSIPPAPEKGKGGATPPGGSAGLSGIWVASWEGGPPLSTWIPALGILDEGGQMRGLNLGPVFGDMQVTRKDNSVVVSGVRNWGGGSKTAFRMTGEVVESEGGSRLMRGQAAYEERAADGSVSRQGTSGVNFNQVGADPASYVVQRWNFKGAGSKSEWAARVIFKPDGGFFAGGWEPSGGCGARPCSAVIQLWERAESDGLRIRVLDDSDRNCAMTMDFSGNIRAGKRGMTGKYSKVSCHGVQKGGFSAELK